MAFHINGSTTAKYNGTIAMFDEGWTWARNEQSTTQNQQTNQQQHQRCAAVNFTRQVQVMRPYLRAYMQSAQQPPFKVWMEISSQILLSVSASCKHDMHSSGLDASNSCAKP